MILILATQNVMVLSSSSTSFQMRNSALSSMFKTFTTILKIGYFRIMTQGIKKIWENHKQLKWQFTATDVFVSRYSGPLNPWKKSFERTIETLKDIWLHQDPKYSFPFVIQISCTNDVDLVGTTKWNFTSAKDTTIIALNTALYHHKGTLMTWTPKWRLVQMTTLAVEKRNCVYLSRESNWKAKKMTDSKL